MEILGTGNSSEDIGISEGIERKGKGDALRFRSSEKKLQMKE
jgi:hypothetical protein